MRLRKWDNIPDFMRCDEVRPYYETLVRRRFQLVAKRMFDVVASLILIVILALPMLALALLIRADSSGKVIYRQERVTQYGRIFFIHKFRTMVTDADRKGAHVTSANDSRITRIGRFLRKYRMDELPQLFDVICGDMTFVGTRPEVVGYVKRYTPEMMATLLLPAGITSEASIRFKDEARMLQDVDSVDETYVAEVLPLKMKYNLESIMKFSLRHDLVIILSTVMAVLGFKGRDGSDESGGTAQ